MPEQPITVNAGDISFGNHLPFVLIGGINVLESEQFAVDVAGHYQEVCRRLDISLIFKASYDKANRSSVHSYRGPGAEAGLAQLAAVKRALGLATLTDVHSPDEAAAAAAELDGRTGTGGARGSPARRAGLTREARSRSLQEARRHITRTPRRSG